MPANSKQEEIDFLDEQGVDHLEVAHEREINFYRIFSNLESDLKVPRFYYGHSYSRQHHKGLLILENVSENASTVPMYPGFTNEQVENVIGELAKIHALSWKHRGWIDKFPESPKQENFVQEMRQIQPDVFGPLLSKSDQFYTLESYEKCRYTQDKYGFPAALIHSDLWAPNILFELDGNGRPTSKLAAIIDWQTAHPGNPCEDLARLLSGNTSSTYRRANTERLLRYYMDRVGSYCDGRAPFNYEQLVEAYHASMGYVLAFMTFGAPMHLKMPHIVDGVYPGEFREELLSRVRMFCEDTLEANGL